MDLVLAPSQTVDPASCVWRRFRSHPDLPALVTRNAVLSYAQLETRVTDLAQAIAATATAAGSVMAIECGRGLPSALALLAAFRARHVPLLTSVNSPAAIREQFIHAADAAYTVSGNTVSGLTISPTPSFSGAGHCGDAYITATSGTTGVPRLCRVDANVFRAYTDDVLKAYGLTVNDRVLQFAPPDFDVFVEEVIPTLAIGGCLVVPPWDHAPAVSEFLAFVAAQEVTVLNLPSSYWMAVAEHLRATGAPMPQAVRLVVIGSEPVARPLVDWWVADPARPRLLNAYGVAELAPTCSIFDCTELRSAVAPASGVPIGRPLPFALMSVVRRDDDNDAGTLRVDLPPHLRPPGFAPFDTGDFAMMDKSGVFRVQGRADLSKLKRGGVTVNVHAVVDAARQCNGVLGVAPRIEQDNGTFVLLVQSALSARDVAMRVKQQLARTFPAAWLPDAILPADPTTQVAGAKVTRGPATKRGDAALTDTIRAVWAEHLGQDSLSEGADFFDAGGDSIAAVRTCTAVAQAIGANVPIQIIFAHPTFDEFVGAVRALASPQ